MKASKFEEISEQMLSNCTKTLFRKAEEYASDEDRLANFKQPTTLMGANQAEVCLWYDAKHIASLVKIAKDINRDKYPTMELLQEKVGDYINYGLLFYANVVELIEENKLTSKKQT